MQIFTTIITTFVFGGPSNLSQEKITHVNTIATHQQDKLYPLFTCFGLISINQLIPIVL